MLQTASMRFQFIAHCMVAMYKQSHILGGYFLHVLLTLSHIHFLHLLLTLSHSIANAVSHSLRLFSAFIINAVSH